MYRWHKYVYTCICIYVYNTFIERDISTYNIQPEKKVSYLSFSCFVLAISVMFLKVSSLFVKCDVIEDF